VPGPGLDRGEAAGVGGDVDEAEVDLALAEAGPDELVLVTGSLYTVGEARTALRSRPRPGVETPSPRQ